MSSFLPSLRSSSFRQPRGRSDRPSSQGCTQPLDLNPPRRRATGPGSVSVHHCVAHKFRRMAGSRIERYASFGCRNTSQQSTSTPPCSLILSRWPDCCLPRFTPSMSRTSVPNEWSVHHFVFELSFPNIIFHPDRSQHTFRPKSARAQTSSLHQHPVSSFGRQQPVANAPLM